MQQEIFVYSNHWRKQGGGKRGRSSLPPRPPKGKKIRKKGEKEGGKGKRKKKEKGGRKKEGIKERKMGKERDKRGKWKRKRE